MNACWSGHCSALIIYQRSGDTGDRRAVRYTYFSADVHSATDTSTASNSAPEALAVIADSIMA